MENDKFWKYLYSKLLFLDKISIESLNIELSNIWKIKYFTIYFKRERVHRYKLALYCFLFYMFVLVCLQLIDSKGKFKKLKSIPIKISLEKLDSLDIK